MATPLCPIRRSRGTEPMVYTRNAANESLGLKAVQCNSDLEDGHAEPMGELTQGCCGPQQRTVGHRFGRRESDGFQQRGPSP